jgi:hypothetical protein
VKGGSDVPPKAVPAAQGDVYMLGKRRGAELRSGEEEGESVDGKAVQFVGN